MEDHSSGGDVFASMEESMEAMADMKEAPEPFVYRGFTISSEFVHRTRRLVIRRPTEDLRGVLGSNNLEAAKEKVDGIIAGTLIRKFKDRGEAVEWAEAKCGRVQKTGCYFVVVPDTKRERTSPKKLKPFSGLLRKISCALDQPSWPYKYKPNLIEMSFLWRLKETFMSGQQIAASDRREFEHLHEIIDRGGVHKWWKKVKTGNSER